MGAQRQVLLGPFNFLNIASLGSDSLGFLTANWPHQLLHGDCLRLVFKGLIFASIHGNGSIF